MKKILYMTGLALLLSGCAAKQEEPEIQQQWKPLAAPRAAAAFRKDAALFPVSISVSSSKLAEYGRDPAAVVSQWKAMGIGEVFIQVDSPDFMGKWSDEGKTIRELFAQLRANGMTGGLWIKELDWRCPAQGIVRGRLVRRHGVEERILDDWKSAIAKQHEREKDGKGGILPEKVVLEISCRTYTKHSRRMPEGNLYTWSESGYGASGENAVLLESSLHACQKFGELFGVPVILALDSDYLAAGQQGKLPGADPASLLTRFDRLIVTGQAARPGLNAQSVAPFLTDERVSAGVRPAAHTAMTADGLRRRNWSDFVASMAYLEKKWSATPCRNVVIVDFDRLESLMEAAEEEGGK